MHDTNAADGKGVGSATIRDDEMRLGDLVVAAAGMLASVPNTTVDAPLLTDRAIILMPASAEKMDHVQTKTACGEIDLVPVGS